MKQLKHFILMDEKTEVKDREGLCDHIYQLLTNRFQDPFVSVKMFGSSINGFGFKVISMPGVVKDAKKLFFFSIVFIFLL